MAEFQKVMHEFKRYCETFEHCRECVLKAKIQALIGRSMPFCIEVLAANPEAAEQIIMDWAAKHPRATMLDVFARELPEADLRPDGTFKLCPGHYDNRWTNLCTDGKGDCRECWGREV